MSKHTPGPWVAVLHGEEDRRANVAGLGRWRIVCDTPHGHLFEDADARLIAAAPELYEALRGLLNALPSATTHPATQAARAALAKVEGE